VRGTGKSIELIGYASQTERSAVLPRAYDTDPSHTAADVTSLDELLVAPAGTGVAPQALLWVLDIRNRFTAN